MALNIKEKIKALARAKNAIILAHYYQIPEIQDVADYIGDSLDLSKKAMETEAEIIVFAGVRFMAETAKILNPEKKVLLPDLSAGCSLADHCTPEAFRIFLNNHPNHVVVTYINCSAEIKAMSDYVCTSANAEAVIASIPPDQPIIFAPDRNLGNYLIRQTGREMVLWDGSCVVHEAFSIDKLLALYREHPEAKIIAHPESEKHLLQAASFIGSTRKMIDFVKTDTASTYIVATEAGILYEMQKQAPHKHLVPAPAKEDNSCACSECAYMKVNTLEKLYTCLIREEPKIELSDSLIKQAHQPLKRMCEM
ncbi:quinolinate synthase NadA [Ekhidna sp.]|uniref:quinolinate synthase NadA n=1 Tax=Ekhidna sp. TaxID=2608089 RepID=UPI003B5A1363